MVPFWPCATMLFFPFSFFSLDLHGTNWTISQRAQFILVGGPGWMCDWTGKLLMRRDTIDEFSS